MKKTILVPAFAICILLISSCTQPTKQEGGMASTVAPVSTPSIQQVRADIEEVERQWAAAMNTRNLDKLMELYADDAISMPDGAATLSGKAAIRKQQEAEFAQPAKYASVAFETTDVYAQGDVVTEIGKSMFKDAAGKVVGSGKYMAVFEKRNGKYVCIREIFNDDSKK
jgi:uncharacterized protein (TIGR02246 family)